METRASRRSYAPASLILVVLVCAFACKREPPPSRGFQPALNGKPDTLTPEEVAKLKRAQTAPPALHFTSRPNPKNGVDLYVDEKLQRTVPTGELEEARPVKALTGDARVVLAHADGVELWIRGSELTDYEIRTNRRGLVKIEKKGEPEGGGGLGGGKKQGISPRKNELREVRWIEVRTPSSAKLAGEP